MTEMAEISQYHVISIGLWGFFCGIQTYPAVEFCGLFTDIRWDSSFADHTTKEKKLRTKSGSYNNNKKPKKAGSIWAFDE